MTDLSDRFEVLATRLLTRFGQSVTFTRDTQGAFNPSTGETSTPTTTNYTVLVAPRDYTAFEKDLQSIERGDIRLTVQKPSTVPELDDRTTIRSQTYAVVDVETLSVNGVDVAYILRMTV